MMRILLLITALLFILLPVASLAMNHEKDSVHEHGDMKGPVPSDSAYEHASDEARFKRDEGWVPPGQVKKGMDDNEEALRHKERIRDRDDVDDGRTGRKEKPIEKKMKRGDDDDNDNAEDMKRQKQRREEGSMEWDQRRMEREEQRSQERPKERVLHRDRERQENVKKTKTKKSRK